MKASNDKQKPRENKTDVSLDGLNKCLWMMQWMLMSPVSYNSVEIKKSGERIIIPHTLIHLV